MKCFQMNNLKTHITFVLDSSGSMAKIADDTKGGFNTLLFDQREEDGEATISLYDFNETVTKLYDHVEIDEAAKLTDENYTPSGRTALHDAVSTAITETDDRIATIPESQRPTNVVIVILTDGKENASETPQDHVRELVGQYQDRGWEFLFIGANQDAALTAEQMGMDADHSLDMQHSGEGTRAAYKSTSENIGQARRTGDTGGFDEKDRRRQRGPDGE